MRDPWPLVGILCVPVLLLAAFRLASDAVSWLAKWHGSRTDK